MSWGPVSAQQFPARPIRIVVPFPPGGTTDVVARLVAQRFSESMKQSVVVDNRGGAGGALGADIVAKETADGGAGSARLGAWMRPGSGL
jgi:tripartite-type tricarboxylate transporter receptor subunit TctC